MRVLISFSRLRQVCDGHYMTGAPRPRNPAVFGRISTPRVAAVTRRATRRAATIFGTMRRFALLVALCGQLAMLAHGALVAHVTCGDDGELLHVRPDGDADGAVAAPTRDVIAAGRASDSDAHDHCLLDEDGEAACPRVHVASSEPVAETRATFAPARAAVPAPRRAPLYRLAPKNSPPASSRST
jgi:hypothetical protein